MAKVYLEDSELTNIGNAIREKNGATAKYLPSEMPAAIKAIETGGGGEDITPFLKMPGRADYLFYNDRFRTTYAPYQDRLDWSSVSYMQHMFDSISGDWSGWNITIPRAPNQAWDLFYNADCVAFPHLTINSFGTNGALEIFYQANGKDRAGDESMNNVKLGPISPGQSARGFMSRSGNRICPDCYRTFVGHNETYTGSISSTGQSNPYYNAFYTCRAIEEITDVPLWTKATITISNMIGTNQRLRRFTFETKPDGSPYECPNYTVSLSFTGNYGYSPSSSGTGYGRGFSTAKVIKDDTTYQSLKNDPERCPQTAPYSDYNHTAAVETINSLPIVKSGTITFEGAQGSATDGGAISNLTDAEIAVATERGWTITIK